jgi:hypothetical protein
MEIQITLIDPSPYQHRRHFGEDKLKELAKSISRDGLLQPITVRKTGDRYELIAGERRLRAARDHAGMEQIDCRIIEADDMSARRLCAAENLQRDDLSAIEEVGAIVEMVDAELVGDAEYDALGEIPEGRVKGLLGRLETANRHDKVSNEAEKFAHKFMGKTETIFDSLPKPVTWRSFYNNDLGILKIPQDILDWAIAAKLNKEQTKALSKLDRHVISKNFEANNDGVLVPKPDPIATVLGDESDPPQSIREMSAKEIVGLGKTERILMRHEEYTKRIAESVQQAPPTIAQADCIAWLKSQEPADLLLTDPPYSTDIEDIDSFAKSWLPLALSKLKPTGRAYVCVGAYPKELAAYMAAAMPDQILVWTYRNTLGPSPTHQYKLNWQAILYYQMPDAPPLDCPIMLEQFSVQEINAPDGRLGDRYHAWQKPMQLGEQLVRHSTRLGEIVLDPFACTGTFLLAAASLGRIAHGCDINAENIEIAIKRGCVHG